MSRGALALPAKIAIGTIIGMVVLGAILGPAVYFGLKGEYDTTRYMVVDSLHVTRAVHMSELHRSSYFTKSLFIDFKYEE